MDSEGEAGSLTDGLTGWIAELGGCCWADRNAQKHWADTNMPFQEAHLISNDFFSPHLAAPGSSSQRRAMLLRTLAALLYFFNGEHHLQNYATVKDKMKHLEKEVNFGNR